MSKIDITGMTRQELAALVAGKIDTASFRACYNRRDPAIRLFAVIAAGHPMPAVIATMLVPGQDTGTLFYERIIGFIQPMDAATGGINSPYPSVRRSFQIRIDDEVRAFYFPPVYFIQFTSERWE